MIVRLTGGVGNQFFGYTFARALSFQRNEPVQFHWGRATRDYELDKYNTLVELVKPSFNGPVYDEPGFAFDPKAADAPAGVYFRGYWQSYKYFEKYADVIKRELTLKEPVSFNTSVNARLLRKENSVFIHVRRGDYLNPGTVDVHGSLFGSDYYERAIKYVEERVSNPKFYIFTDDPAWCNRNFSYPIFDTANQHEDLYLMQACRHGIGANSSFSWWANWLGVHSDRICIVPKNWFNVEKDLSTLFPEGWIKL